MKSAKSSKWQWRILFVLIVSLSLYGYITERAHRIKVEEAARELLIVHDAEKIDYHNFINSLTLRQIEQDAQIHNLGMGIMHMQKTIYEMYHELRKYNKKLPPWGGEYKPIEPEDKWTKNDT